LRPSRMLRTDSSGGPPQTLCETDARGVNGPPSAAWSRAGVILASGARGGLQQVSQTGGACTGVTGLNGERRETFHGFPSFLPDGRHFLYLRASSAPQNNGIYIGSLDAKPEEQDLKLLLATDSRAIFRDGYLLFLRQGVLMAQPFKLSRMELY